MGGQITSDTIWTKLNSPYVVTSNILVQNEVTLIIEPGVVVKFETEKLMLIEGELIAKGTELDSIVFTSNKSTPNRVFYRKNYPVNYQSKTGIPDPYLPMFEWKFFIGIKENVSIAGIQPKYSMIISFHSLGVDRTRPKIYKFYANAAILRNQTI